MKILMVSPRPPQRKAAGGPGVVLHTQLMEIASRHDVTLLTLAGPDEDHREALSRLRDAGIETYAVWRTQPSGVQLWQRRTWLARAWLGTRYPWLAIVNWDRRTQQLLDRLLTERAFDLLDVYDKAELGIYRYPTKVPRLLTEQEVRHSRPVDWRGWTRANAIAWALREADWQRWDAYQRAVWRGFDRIQVFTPYDAQAIRTMVPEIADRVRINPFGIAIPAQADPTWEEPETVIFTGSFGHAPNVDAALWLGQEIMPLLRARRPGVRLFLVGSMPPPEVQALAAPDVIVTGRVPEVEPFLARAAVVLAPVRSGGGQRTKVLQGMAMAKPVVTTLLGAQGLELAGTPPPLLIAADTAGIVDATIRLLESPGLREELGNRARAAVEEQYSPAAFARRIEDIYAELRPPGGGIAPGASPAKGLAAQRGLNVTRLGWEKPLPCPPRLIGQPARLPGHRSFRLPARGLSVALLGPDGAGKSTLADGIRRACGLPVRAIYMGLWPQTAASPAPLRIPGANLAGHLVKVWWRYLVGRYHQARGRLVIFDRYTYDALLNSPQRLDWRNRLYYGLLGHACPAPDLVILLDAPGSIMFRRKGEHSPAQLEEQRQRFLALQKQLPRLQVVDATAPADAVRDEVVARIRRRYAARQGGKRP